MYLYFDPNGKFDFDTFLDIPRDPNVDVEPLGVVEDLEKDQKKMKLNIHTRVGQELYLLGKGFTYVDIARTLGKTFATVSSDLYKFRAYDLDPKVLEMLCQK